jgi:peptidoglycan/xylan/chitin deacetylase (PgdA/CDA1 family)
MLPLDPLPVFSSSVLREGIVPVQYIQDTCDYLSMRWQGSPPHTVAVPVMFHSITRDGRNLAAAHDIYQSQFDVFVQYARRLGFTTITTVQLEGFLYRNELIPERSMILIVDDRRPGVIQDNFLPVLRENQWTVTLGWISDSNPPLLWERMEWLHSTGLLDVQAHGFRHKYIQPGMSEDEVREEISASIPVIEGHFGGRPRAYIWPGGNYTAEAVQIAREAGYTLGFTVESPMPLRFNWIPQSPKAVEAGDPLMLLPRAWSSEVNLKLDRAVKVADEARAFAINNYALEADWYARVCGGELPPLSSMYPEAEAPVSP